MSFSKDVKLEILESMPKRKSYKDALAYGIFFYAQSYSEKEIILRTRLEQVADEFVWIAKKILKDTKNIKRSETKSDDPIYTVSIVGAANRKAIICYFDSKKNEFLKDIEDEHIKYAFLAGAFLSCGNITDPKKSYHLEFVVSNQQSADELVKLLERRLPKLKVSARRKQFVVYCKECSQIQDALTMMGASKASLQMIEVEMFKDVRNKVNRVTNCETANIGKQVGAATSQIDDITLILNLKGESYLTPQQLETAKIRVNNPYASLRELAELFPEPISRSGLHHRLAAISKIAEEIREDIKEQEKSCV